MSYLQGFCLKFPPQNLQNLLDLQENKFELGAQNRKTLLTCDLPEVQFLASLTELESKKKLTRKKPLKTLFRTSIQLYLAAMCIPKKISEV